MISRGPLEEPTAVKLSEADSNAISAKKLSCKMPGISKQWRLSKVITFMELINIDTRVESKAIERAITEPVCIFWLMRKMGAQR